MRKPSDSAFTLIEMLTVVAIIVILTGIVLNISGYVQKKAALSRAAGEIASLSTACDSYKSDNGNYPRDVPVNNGTSVTDLISPKQHFVPTDSKYAASSLFLYMELTSDRTTNGEAGSKPDGIPDDVTKQYLKEYDARILNVKRNTSTRAIIQVNYLQDPFGFPYAFSTAAAKAEQTFQTNLKLGKSGTRPTGSALPGFNAGSFDLWSTGGNSTRKSSQTDDNVWASWVKNW